ncbi:MAG: ABC transporter permease subunit [Pleurocapsa minor GSE-CHR-MK-17-07R]|nr:ABC transporter permease subunit [Pleurocapsa minor GSE-CHR-MK 17-07R]
MTMKATAQPTAKGIPAAPSVASRAGATTGRFVLNKKSRGIVIRQVLLQLFLLLMLIVVMFPIMWIVSMAIDPRGIARPVDLNLFPANANLDAFRRLLSEPISNTFSAYVGNMLMNSLFIALGVSVFTVVLGSSAAYAFSRFRFVGRQTGMLMFIVLLLLPSTGVIIPLYIMFNAVQISSTVAEFFPSIFAGILVASIVAIIFGVVRSYGKRDLERAINPPPQLVVGTVAAFSLVAIIVTFAVMFARTPMFNEAVGQPLNQLSANVIAAQAEVNQRTQSVGQRETTATRREERATVAEESAAEVARLAELTTAEELATELQAVIDQRSGIAPDDLAVVASVAALEALNADGADAAIASLDASLVTAQEEATSLRDGAVSARQGAEDAAASLAIAVDTLNAAITAQNEDGAFYSSIQTNTLLQMTPYILGAWAAALAVSAVIWFILRALPASIERRTVLNIMLFSVMAFLVVAFTISTLQYRLTLVRGDQQTLRTTLLGLALAFSSGGLPFAIWNLKGYFDTIPKELEEAALIDGAGRLQTFIRIMIPLALPAFAIVILFSFMNGWTEFILSWIFMTGQTQNYTLAMALATLTGGANQPPPDMQKFAALSILISLPIMILFFSFQRFIVGGLSLGGVKG